MQQDDLDSPRDEPELIKVIFRDHLGRPIDFGQDSLTAARLLEVLAKQYEVRGVRPEIDLFEPPLARVEIVRADSFSQAHHDKIAHSFRDGSTFQELIEKLGWRGRDWPLRQAFLHLDGIECEGWGIIVINNRRLQCVNRHQKQVPWPVYIEIMKSKSTVLMNK
jgi:hypothetical protein